MRFFFINESYGRGSGVRRGLGVGVDRGVSVAVAVGVIVAVAVGVAVAVEAVAVGVGVGVGVPDCAQYLPPVLRIPHSRASRPRRSFHCRSRLPCGSTAHRAHRSCWWLSNYRCRDCIFRRCSNGTADATPTPDDHFTAGPYCRVNGSGSRRISRAGRRPTIRARIVSATGVITKLSTPDDHFIPGPHCRVTEPRRWRVGCASGYPAIRTGIVSPAVLKSLSPCHPRRSFQCRSRLPCDASRPTGALVVLVAVQLSVLGIVSSARVEIEIAAIRPPQTIISLPVQTAV